MIEKVKGVKRKEGFKKRRERNSRGDGRRYKQYYSTIK